MQAIKKFFDPLRLHCSLNILGDICIMMSGVVYHNPLRSIAALSGASTHIVGIFFSKKKIFNVLMSDIVMSAVMFCGVLYMLSGSNIFGFESTPRYTEILGGLCISAAAFSVIRQKSQLAPVLFTLGTTFFSFSAFEVWFVRGEVDWLVLMGSLMFYAAGFVSAFIKKESVVT